MNEDNKTPGNNLPNKKPIIKISPKGGHKGNFNRAPRGFFGNLITTILVIFAVILIFSMLSDSGPGKEEIALSKLASDIKSDIVETITVRGDEVEAKYKDSEILRTTKIEANSSFSETLVNYGLTADEISQITIDIQNETGFLYWVYVLAPFLLPLFFILFLIWYLSRQVKGAGMQAFTFGQSNARLINPKDKSKVTFRDVAGAKEAKEELMEIVDFLKNPKKFLDIGAQIPKGIILMGAPGTGKTLLARATAGEAGVSFFSVSGSEFVEMFVGVGASRVRDLFKLAKATSPAIVFIDEIDAVGRARGVGVGGGNDEREQTLNQILVEMDGFEPADKVIVMAATNRPDVLDPAILRPGRFDRRVTIDLPDRKDREDILKVHAKNKPLAEDVNFVVLSERTPGFSGADLYSMVNEAAILAARENRKKVGQFDLIRSIEKVLLGPERRSHLLTEKEKKITAYHEAGHALVASLLPNADPVHKISIIARGRAGGYTIKLPSEDRKLQSRKEFLDDLAMSLGGYVTEKMIFGDITTGPSSDLQVATSLARDMVTKFGMSDKFGPMALEGNGGRIILGRGFDDKEYAEKFGDQIDAEVSKLLNDAQKRAEKILTENKKVLDALAGKLLEVETLEREEYEKLLATFGIKVRDSRKDKESLNLG
ncbi:MAG TPA: ATP-dependent zinc metalloprotease FtsH [Candidatus Paceibacterota bacterium]|nr:ATP-dependent zinc metalloprotease FtsH [Candidatus Paceibacterota bacterium]HRZ34337.1 ATP-dependent zinc metalloprotease FtsH [Candidatus Paceibacterota bacterium]